MRNITKTIADYKGIVGEQKDTFFLSDISQIYDLAKDPGTGKVNIFTAIEKALDAGFVLGYRYANQNKQ